MFNWICPQCGQEVLSSYAECPNCAKAAAAKAADPQAQPTAPPVQPMAPQAPPQQPLPPREPARSAFLSAPPVQPPMQAPQYYAQPPQSRGLPTWLLSIVFALAFVGLGAGVYWAIQHFKSDGTKASAETTAPPVDPKAKPNPYQKFIEITGIRLFQDPKKKVAARFLLVNHMDGEMTDIAGNVDIRGRTAKEGEEPVGTFQFKVPSVGPNEAKEVTVPVDTKLKVYELPDWQMVDARLQLTSPK